VLASAALVTRDVRQDRREPGGDGGSRRWAREGVLPVYMLHQTVAVVLAAWILSGPVAAGVQCVVLTALTVACSLALYELPRHASADGHARREPGAPA